MERHGVPTNVECTRHDLPDHSADIRNASPWIASTLAGAMRRAQLIGLVLVTLVLCAASFLSATGGPAVGAIIAAVLVLTSGLLTIHRRVSAVVLIGCHFLVLAFYYVVALDPGELLTGLLIPLTSWTVVLPIMLWRGVWPLTASVALGAGFGALILVSHPTWDSSVAAASATTNCIMIVLAFLFMRYLRRVSDGVDGQRNSAAQQKLRALRSRALDEATLEYIRVLHDTVINTFGVIGRLDPYQIGTGQIDTVQVRERCRRDLRRVEEFQRHPGAERVAVSLTDLDHVGLPIEWTGLREEALRAHERLLLSTTLEALYGCAMEAVLNATKHSGATHVTCDVHRVQHELVVVVSDSGRGFSRSQVRERGIANSIFARAEANGIRVALRTAPGRGTTLTLRCPIPKPAPVDWDALAAEARNEIRDFKLRLGVVWGLHATLTGALLEVFSWQRLDRPAVFPALLLVAILGSLTLATWLACRRWRQAPPWLTLLLLLAVPIVSWCSLAGIDFGRGELYFVPAVAATVIPVLLYVTSASRRPFAISILLHLLSTGVITVAALRSNAEIEWCTIALIEAPSLGLIGVLFVFLRSFRAIGTQVARSRQEVEEAARDAAASEAAVAVKKQWSASNLKPAIELLRGIADGTLLLADPETRERCEREESRLRQLITLPRDASLMNWWFALAASEAEGRGVTLVLPAEYATVAESGHVQALGTLLVECVYSAPAGSTLSVNLIEQAGRPRMLVVGDAEATDSALEMLHASEGLSVVAQRLRGQTLVEAIVRER